jgi:hypothetical protein
LDRSIVSVRLARHLTEDGITTTGSRLARLRDAASIETGPRNGIGRGLPCRLQVRPRRILLGAIPILGENGLAEERGFRHWIFLKDGHERAAGR